MKACRVCGRVQELDAFPVANRCIDGHAHECLECRRLRNREYMRQRRQDHPEILRAQLATYRVRTKAYHKQRHQELKAEVIARYGGQCACCGEASLCFLTIDHVHNDGNEHRGSQGRMKGASIYRWLKTEGFPQDGRFQVLCYNCNCAKQHDRDGHRAAHPNAKLIDGGDE